MAKKSLTSGITWHFFLPAGGGFAIAWIFSQNLTLSFEVGIVVLMCSFIARYLKDK